MHIKITYKGFENDEVLDSMLLYMYGICAAVAEAHEVLGKLQCWEILMIMLLISEDGLHGYNDNALEMFDEMIVDNVPPNFVIYGSVLKSCITLKTLPKAESYTWRLQKRDNIFLIHDRILKIKYSSYDKRVES